MLSLIKKITDEDLGIILDDMEANHLLECIESAGMLPPSTTFKLGTMSILDNGWEPEDD